MLKETARKINDTTSHMERRIIEELEKIKGKNEDNINNRMDKVIAENEQIIKLLHKVIEGDD